MIANIPGVQENCGPFSNPLLPSLRKKFNVLNEGTTDVGWQHFLTAATSPESWGGEGGKILKIGQPVDGNYTVR